MPDVMVKYAIDRDPDIKRQLTGGEVRIANMVFGTALKTHRVRVHNRRYLPFQGEGVAMTPNGHLYFTRKDYKKDFSLNNGLAAWFVHELTHAWQYQTGRSTRLRGLWEQIWHQTGVNDAYKYDELDPNREFKSYRNEQQAAIVEDYFRLKKKMPFSKHGHGTLENYERVIPFVPKTIMLQRAVRA